MTPRRLKAIKEYPSFADIRPLIAEIDRLRGLVKTAYIEAYQNDWCWANSESRKALEGK